MSQQPPPNFNFDTSGGKDNSASKQPEPQSGAKKLLSSHSATAGAAGSEQVQAASESLKNAAGQAAKGVGDFIRSDAVQNQVKAASNFWSEMSTPLKALLIGGPIAGFLMMSCCGGCLLMTGINGEQTSRPSSVADSWGSPDEDSWGSPQGKPTGSSSPKASADADSFVAAITALGLHPTNRKYRNTDERKIEWLGLGGNVSYDDWVVAVGPPDQHEPVAQNNFPEYFWRYHLSSGNDIQLRVVVDARGSEKRLVVQGVWQDF